VVVNNRNEVVQPATQWTPTPRCIDLELNQF